MVSSAFGYACFGYLCVLLELGSEFLHRGSDALFDPVEDLLPRRFSQMLFDVGLLYRLQDGPQSQYQTARRRTRTRFGHSLLLAKRRFEHFGAARQCFVLAHSSYHLTRQTSQPLDQVLLGTAGQLPNVLQRVEPVLGPTKSPDLSNCPLDQLLFSAPSRQVLAEVQKPTVFLSGSLLGQPPIEPTQHTHRKANQHTDAQEPSPRAKFRRQDVGQFGLSQLGVGAREFLDELVLPGIGRPSVLEQVRSQVGHVADVSDAFVLLLEKTHGLDDIGPLVGRDAANRRCSESRLLQLGQDRLGFGVANNSDVDGRQVARNQGALAKRNLIHPNPGDEQHFLISDSQRQVDEPRPRSCWQGSVELALGQTQDPIRNRVGARRLVGPEPRFGQDSECAGGGPERERGPENQVRGQAYDRQAVVGS